MSVYSMSVPSLEATTDEVGAHGRLAEAYPDDAMQPAAAIASEAAVIRVTATAQETAGNRFQRVAVMRIASAARNDNFAYKILSWDDEPRAESRANCTSSMPIARCVEVNGGTTRCREPRFCQIPRRAVIRPGVHRQRESRAVLLINVSTRRSGVLCVCRRATSRSHPGRGCRSLRCRAGSWRCRPNG